MLHFNNKSSNQKVNTFTNVKGMYTDFSADKRKNAFTLAEVLITLGIIGVVAAMTLPSVIGKYQKHVTVSKLQKVYTVLNQALSLSEQNNSEYKYWPSGFDIGVENYFNQYWKPYLNVMHVCKTYKDCGYNSNIPWVRINGEPYTLSLVAPRARTTFYLEDGILVILMSAGGDADGLVAADITYVDINGPGKPNMLGRDVFLLSKLEQKGVKGFVAYGHNTGSNINVGCRITGYTCLAKIIADGWKIKDDYPW